MYQFDNHTELALQDVIPYLLKFPELYQMAEQSGDRYQIIENIVWQLLYNLDYTQAEGVWLDYIGKKVGQSRVYSSVPQNAFTFGGTKDEGFGTGHFKSVSSLQNTKSARSNASFRNAIKAKIIQNNTDTSLDELIEACKLLFDASVVKIEEAYPANINRIDVYGTSVLETLDAISIIKKILPAGVSLQHFYFHNFYNLFKNNAFVAYDDTIPQNDDFELSLNVQPDILPSDQYTEIPIFSQDESFASEFNSVSLVYSKADGFRFQTSPAFYTDGFNKYYLDGDNAHYVDSETDIYLSGASNALVVNESTNVKITREGNTWSLYVNDKLIDQETKEHEILTTDSRQLFIGLSDGEYYNSGSLYNVILKNNTTGKLIINDPLKTGTTGHNNGVRFL